MSELKELPNIGKNLEKELKKVGITSYKELAECGSVDALLRINEKSKRGCYNMLYALEGAIQGIRWHDLPKEEREILKKEYLKEANRK